jgi:MFS transporter, DHA1 family, inner membrane transport protein
MTNKPLVVTLALASFTGLLSQFLLSPLLPIVAADIGSSVPLLGQTITVMFLAGALLVLAIGPIADCYGHKRIMLAGVALVALSGFGTALADGYWSVLLTRLPGGLGGGVMAAVAVVLASNRVPPEERRQAIGWTITGIAAAPIVGAPSIAFIAERFGWQMPFVAHALVSMIVFGLLIWTVSPDGAIAGTRLRIRDIINAYGPLLRDQTARLLQVCNGLRAVGWGAAVTYFAAYLVEVEGLSLHGVGYLMIVSGVGYFFGTRLGDGRVKRLGLRSLFAVSTALMGLILGSIYMLPIPLPIIVALLVPGVAAGGIGFVALTILIAEESPGGQATAMMLRQSGFSLGLAGGGAAGGLAIAVGGYGLMGVGVLAFALVSSVVIYRVAPAPATPAEPVPAPEPAGGQ